MNKPVSHLDPIRSAHVLMALNHFLNTELDRQPGSLPKYVRLENALVNAIDDGVLVEGDKLPSEAELTHLSSFSLGTVQKAMRSLADAGHVIRKTGVGTVVQANFESMRRPLHSRFSKDGGPFLAVFPKIVGRVEIAEKGPWSKAFDDGTQIVRIDRRNKIGDELIVFSRFYVDGAKFSFLMDRPVKELHAENFKLLMFNETGQKIRRYCHKIGYSVASPEVANHIGTDSGEQVLKIKVTALDQSNVTIYYQEFFVPPNDLDLTIDHLV